MVDHPGSSPSVEVDADADPSAFKFSSRLARMTAGAVFGGAASLAVLGAVHAAIAVASVMAGVRDHRPLHRDVGRTTPQVQVLVGAMGDVVRTLPAVARSRWQMDLLWTPGVAT